MSDQLQLRRDTFANIQAATPAQGELAFATDTDELFAGDGATAGGIRVGPSFAIPGYVAGRYYFGMGASPTTLAVAANTLYANPFFCLKRVIFTKIGAYVATAAGTHGRVGVYNWGYATGLPSSLLIDGGAISDAATGYQENTGLSITLNPGVYALVFLADSTPTMQIVTNGGFQALAQLALGSSGATAGAESAITVPQTYGPLPATFPTAGLAYLTAGGPAVGLRL